MEAEPEASPAAPPRLTRADWGLIFVLVAIQFTHMVDFVIVMPLGGRLMTELAINAGQFAWVVSAYSFAAVGASLLAASVLDRYDRRTVLLTMYAGFALSNVACGLAPNYSVLVASRALAGATGGLAAVTLMAVIGDVFPPAKRGRAAGAVMSAFAVASIAGLPAGLLLVDGFGRGAPFIALAAVSGLVWAVAWVRLPAVNGHVSAARRRPADEFLAVAREPNHLWAFVFSFFTVMGSATVATFIGPYFSGLNGWTENDLSVLYLVGGVLTLVGMNVVGRLSDRLPRRPLFRVLAGGSLVMAVVVANMPPSGLAVAAIVLGLFMVTAAGRVVPAQALLLGVAAPPVRGAFLSLNTSVQHLATGVAPLVGGLFLSRAADGRLEGYSAVGFVAAATAAVSLVLVGRLRMYAPPTPAEPVHPVPAADAEPKQTAV